MCLCVLTFVHRGDGGDGSIGGAVFDIKLVLLQRSFGCILVRVRIRIWFDSSIHFVAQSFGSLVVFFCFFIVNAPGTLYPI